MTMVQFEWRNYRNQDGLVLLVGDTAVPFEGRGIRNVCVIESRIPSQDGWVTYKLLLAVGVTPLAYSGQFTNCPMEGIRRELKSLGHQVPAVIGKWADWQQLGDDCGIVQASWTQLGRNWERAGALDRAWNSQHNDRMSASFGAAPAYAVV